MFSPRRIIQSGRGFEVLRVERFRLRGRICRSAGVIRGARYGFELEVGIRLGNKCREWL